MRIFGEGNGTPLQHSCLENPMNRGAWWAAVHGVTKSRTQLRFHFSLWCIGEGNGNPFQCSCLENPRDGGAWWAAIYGIAQSRTWLKRLSSSTQLELWVFKLKASLPLINNSQYGLKRSCDWLFISVICGMFLIYFWLVWVFVATQASPVAAT